MKTLTTLLVRGLLLTTLACATSLAAAQEYPNRPIRLIVPYPPGGAVDIFARAIAAKVAETSKWTMVVDNRAGAGGSLGLDQAAKAVPDGYTLVLGQTSNFSIAPALFPNLPYDPLKDLVAVAPVATAPSLLVVGANSPYKSLNALLAGARANPGKVDLATPGNGTVAHLTGELLQSVAKVKFQHIPYKGSPQAITDLIAGETDVFVATVPTALPQLRTGRMVALAVTSLRRSPELPQVPTIEEAGGFKGFEAVSWWGFFAPAKTPAAIVQRVSAEVAQALKTPEVKARFAAEGADMLGGSAEEFAAFVRKDHARWGQVVREAGVKVD